MKPAGARLAAVMLLFVLGFGAPVAGGYYSKNVSSKEGNKGELMFPPDKKKGVKPAEIDVAKFGSLKRTLQPWTVRIYTSVNNKSKESRRVGVVLENCPVPAKWHVTDYTWDAETRAIREPLPPGKKFGVYIFVAIPEELRHRPVICDGRLKAVAPETGEVLATLPLRLLNSAAGPVSKGGGDRSPIPDGYIHNH